MPRPGPSQMDRAGHSLARVLFATTPTGASLFDKNRFRIAAAARIGFSGISPLAVRHLWQRRIFVV